MAVNRSEAGATLSGWGGTAVPGHERLSEELAEITRDVPLSRGLGRSYGDSALPPPDRPEVAGTRLADRFLELDASVPRLRAEAGVALGDLIWTLLGRGYFPPVTPGTQYVTLGGMVAADVHGKNHHVAGTIGRHVDRLLLRVASGDLVECSRDTNGDLFRATLGGMGLTGHILEVDLRLERIPTPWIVAETERHGGLEPLLAAMAEAARAWPFTMAWIDCLKRGSALGRGVLYRGRWATAEEAPEAVPRSRPGPAVPFTMPGWVLSNPAVALFNSLVYHSKPRHAKRRIVSPETFFYPLDRIRHWNRIYGPSGFTQFQCVLPEAERQGAVRRFLEVATRLGGSTFLCVLKDCGAEGEGVLSFPRPGISVALDLPMRPGIERTVDALAEATIAEGGRVYLAKDLLLSAERFRAMEPRLAEFERIRARWDPERRIRSAQSVRLLEDPA